VSEPATPAPTSQPTRLLLVDDHQVVLDGLQSMLASQRDRVDIVAATTNASEALRLAGELKPDVVLCDIRLRGASGLDLCRDIVEQFPSVRVVFFTVYDDEQYLFQALRMGASGFLLKTTTAPELVEHLDRVMEGEVAVDAVLAGRVAMTAARLQSGEFWPGARFGLTQRGPRPDGAGPVQPGHRPAALHRRGDGEEPHPGDLPQARGLRPSPGHSRRPTRGSVPLSERASEAMTLSERASEAMSLSARASEAMSLSERASEAMSLSASEAMTLSERASEAMSQSERAKP
jgi:DNA-binding NarL/FixJ family response regulator